jgi:hypothetical protein
MRRAFLRDLRFAFRRLRKRTVEFGIRRAFGARAVDTVSLVLRRALKQA